MNGFLVIVACVLSYLFGWFMHKLCVSVRNKLDQMPEIQPCETVKEILEREG